MMSAPSSDHLRPRTPLGPILWGLSLTAAATALIGSLVVQRFMATADADPERFPKAHVAWCTGELLSLRVELEEAMLQELTGHGTRPELTRAEQVRRRSWNARLAEVSGRCRHSDLAQNSAQGLQELADRYVHVVDELHDLRTGLAQAVDSTLTHLKND
jgi:hypothetical protein